MKLVEKSLLLAVCMIMLQLPAFAQISQNGKILEYQGAKPKTNLAGVSIAVMGAGATMSDNDGNYTLQFRVLHAGDKVNVRRIERSGFELLNPEELNQWYISKDGKPYNIVMCNSEQLKKTRDNYRQISTSNYTKTLEDAEQKLADNRSKGLITEEEFNSKIEELENAYEKQISNIETYIDRFARIDLSTLSEVETQIVKLVEQGEFDKAIELIEKEDLVGKLKKESEDKKNLSVAKKKVEDAIDSKSRSMDSLYSAIDRQVDLLGMAGGIENYEKMGEILRQSSEVDTTNTSRLIKYGSYLKLQTNYTDALAVYEMAARQNTSDMLESIMIRSQISGLMTTLQKYDEACAMNSALIKELCEKCDTTTQQALECLYRLQINNALTYFRMKQDSIAEIYYLATTETALRIMSINHEAGMRQYALSQFSNGNYYMGTQNYEKAKAALEETLRIIPEIRNAEHDPDINLPKTQGIYSQVCLNLGDTENARKYSKLSLEGATQRYKHNPAGNLYPLAVLQFQSALLHLGLKEKQESLRMIDAAIESFSELAKKQPKAFGNYLEAIKGYRPLIEQAE